MLYSVQKISWRFCCFWKQNEAVNWILVIVNLVEEKFSGSNQSKSWWGSEKRIWSEVETISDGRSRKSKKSTVEDINGVTSLVKSLLWWISEAK